MSPFACIYVPNFPIAAAIRAEPELQAHPIAIFEGKPPLEKIIAANEKAASLNIAPGMTKAQAELCPELVLRPRSALQENSTHAALLDCAQSFSPCVEDTACDTVLLDLAGMESLFGSLTKISHAIADRAAALGLNANIAAASNSDAALLAARGAVAPASGGLSRGHPAPAPESTQCSKVIVIPAGKEAEKLGSLPTEVLFAEHLEGDKKEEAARLLETLDRWGIRNLRSLAALPEVALSERLGQQGLYLQQLARGAAIRTLVPVETPLIFEEAVELSIRLFFSNRSRSCSTDCSNRSAPVSPPAPWPRKNSASRSNSPTSPASKMNAKTPASPVKATDPINNRVPHPGRVLCDRVEILIFH